MLFTARDKHKITKKHTLFNLVSVEKISTHERCYQRSFLAKIIWQVLTTKAEQQRHRTQKIKYDKHNKDVPNQMQ